MQNDLFADEVVVSIPGLRYQHDFLTLEEEMQLLEVIRSLPLHPAKYKEYLARRQVVSFGGSYLWRPQLGLVAISRRSQLSA